MNSNVYPLQAVERVVVCQSSLDVELWVNGALQSELDSEGFTFHSLTDYDLQLVEVSPLHHCTKHGRKLLHLIHHYVRCVVRVGMWCSSLWSWWKPWDPPLHVHGMDLQLFLYL